MGVRQTVLEHLKQTEGAAADHALVTALSRADEAGSGPIAQTLLERKNREAIKGLVACWHRLDEPLRMQLLAETGATFAVLREVLSFPSIQARSNVVEIIRRGRFYRASYLLETALHDRCVSVRNAAGGALLEMAEAGLAGPDAAGQTGVDPQRPEGASSQMAELAGRSEDHRQLAAALEAGIREYDVHQQAPVVEAALWWVDHLGSGFWKLITTPGSRLLQEAHAVLERSPSLRLVPFMVQALTHTQFRSAVVQHIAACTDPELLAEWFRQSWRLVQSRAARGMIAIHTLAATENRLETILAMPEDAQSHFCRWVPCMGFPEPVQVDLLKEMYRRGQPQVKRSAVWALSRVREEVRSLILLKAIATHDPGVCGWVARQEWARRRPAECRPSALLNRKRGKADAADCRDSQPETAQAYWAAFDGLPEPERLQWGKRLLVGHRLSEVTVNSWLASPVAEDRARALRILTILGIVKMCADRVFELCRDPDVEVRSMAVAALRWLPSAGSRRMLRTALNDADPRVKANAVEGLEILGAAEADDLKPLLDSPDNRTRGNAVKALLKRGVQEAAEALIAMLNHPDRAHRASGLWLVEKLQLLPMTELILRMAESDPDEEIRVKARALAARLAAASGTPIQPPAAREVQV